jgi:hypothetical protein
MWETISNLFRKLLDFLSLSGDKTQVLSKSQKKITKDESYEFDHSDSIELSEELIFKGDQKTEPEGDTLDNIEDQIDSIQEHKIIELVESITPEKSENNDNEQPVVLIDEQINDFKDEPLDKIEDQDTSHQEIEISELSDGDLPEDIKKLDEDELTLIEENQEPDDIELSLDEELFDFSQAKEEITVVESHYFGEAVDEVVPGASEDLVEVEADIETAIDEVDQIPEDEYDDKVESPLAPAIEDNYLPTETITKEVERKRKRKLFYYEIHPIPVLDDTKIDEFKKLAEDGMLKDEFGYDSQRFEVFLLNVFKQYDFIGEIPFGRKSFDYINELVQKCYIKNKRTRINHVPPALFVASMVFCARYSEEEARNFWKPYANIMWRKELSQYFQNVSRKHFVACKVFLQNKYDFEFPIINSGDVVRPVYYHAVIPYYLQSNFAEWLVDHFEKLLEFSIDDLPSVLSEEKSLDYIPPRLRNFVQQRETSDTAAKLIQQMAKAIRLFQTTEQFEAVNSVMSSPIERSLWREIYQDLIENQLQLEKLRKYSPKLEWVWDLDHDDLILMLSQVRSSKGEKPNLIVWAQKGSADLRNEQILIDIHPWELSNGDWELEIESITDKGDLEGKIYVLSEEYDFEKQLGNQDDHIIIDKEIPDITNDILFFFVPANRSVAREKEKININGDWIVLSKDHVEIVDCEKTICAHEDIYLPSILRESGYHSAKRYSITLPVTLQTQRGEIAFKEPQTTFVVQAELLDKNQIKGLSKNVQPIFQTPNVIMQLDAEFTEHQMARTWVSIHKGGNFLTSVSLADLQKENLFYKGDCYFITLKDFIDEPGSYSVNILHDLQLILEDNLRFAYLPDVSIIGPDPNTCYSPENPPEVRVSGVDIGRLKTTIDEKVKVEQSDEYIQLLWKELRFPVCRFSLQWEGNNVNLSWDINRVTAWIDGGGDKKNIIAEQEAIVILNARGDSKEEIAWFIKDTNHRRKINLDYQGVYSRRLDQSALRDLLKSSHLIQSNVAITIREHTWDVFAYNKIPLLNFKSVIYKKPYLSISISQSERLTGGFTIQIRDKEKPFSPITITRVNRLEDNGRFKVDLLPGKYQAEILLGDEILAISQEINVREKITEVVQIPKRDTLITEGEEFTAQNLFENLTSDHKTILRINDNKTPNLISIIKQLVRINSSETWVTREKFDDGLKKLLPSWAVLQYPLRFHTQKHNRILHIFPQQVAFGTKAGKGYMSAKLEHEPIKIYAAWNSDFEHNKTYLWVMVPQEDSIDRFCDLNELLLWPGYQCVDCGIIVGSKSGSYLKLSPQTIVTHMHGQKRSIRDQFIDVVYGTPIEVKVSEYKDKNLYNCYWPNEVVGDNYFNDLSNGKMRPLQGDINIPLDVFEPTDYYIAISEAYQNYTNQSFQIRIKQIIGKENLFKEIKDFVLEKRDEVPAFAAALRLEKQILSNKRLFFLPKYILLLALVIRLKAYNSPLYKNLLDRDNLLENEIVNLTFQAMNSCPKLLEWSIAWVEIFFNHTIS